MSAGAREIPFAAWQPEDPGGPPGSRRGIVQLRPFMPVSDIFEYPMRICRPVHGFYLSSDQPVSSEVSNPPGLRSNFRCRRSIAGELPETGFKSFCNRVTPAATG